MRKCEEAGISDIAFQALDIRDCGRLQRSFDIIECIGVLHHPEDPEAGLASLRHALAPRGILHLAVYSKTARKVVNQLRNIIAERGIGESPDAIREFRVQLIDGRYGPMPAAMLESPDFYSVSGIRNLLFHRRECAHSLTEWLEIARRQGFTLLAVDAPAAVQSAAQRQFGCDARYITVTQWEQLEEMHPFAFAGMYQLWLIGGRA